MQKIFQSLIIFLACAVVITAGAYSIYDVIKQGATEPAVLTSTSIAPETQINILIMNDAGDIKGKIAVPSTEENWNAVRDHGILRKADGSRFYVTGSLLFYEEMKIPVQPAAVQPAQPPIQKPTQTQP